jgi:hypothetical protein
MSDPVSAAKSAREALARALGAIQSDPKVPQPVLGIAEPISNAMGALFQIEKSGGAAAAAHAPAALEATRRALGLLQQQPSNHPAVQQALEAVAGSLGLIHSLTKVPPGQIVHDPRQAPPAPAPRPPQAAQPQQAPPQQAYAAQPQHAQPAQPPRQAPPAPQQQQQQHGNPPAPPPQQYANPPVQSPQAYAATYVASAAAVAPTQAAAAPYQATMMAEQPVAAQAHAVAAPGNGPSMRVDAELGAHSPSNFYKGLSGNDVVEHGGIFIATYKIPRVGQPLTVHVSMPGGYEFDAAAIVRWTRETVESSQGTSAPPGFGAQFTQIAPEARQLIYRYVRNREPLFHDDL